MAGNKTIPKEKSVENFIHSVEDPSKQEDCRILLHLMQEITGMEPVMWGESIVGFGEYHYTYASGREGDWFLAGFSPRKQNLTIYVMGGYLEHYSGILSRLGKHKHGKGCLYIKRLGDVDLEVLRELITTSVRRLKTKK